MTNISYQYGIKNVLKDVSFSVKRGESWVLFGADDAGKTVLLQLLMGYDIFYKGKVSLLGVRPNRMGKQQREKVRYVPDDLLWEKKLTGTAFFRCAERASSRYDPEIQTCLCQYFQLPVEKRLLEMSYQDNKLIQITAALAACPELLILDEPMNFLEPDVWKRTLGIFRIFRKNGMTLLIAAGEYEDVQGQCDHFAYLRDGRLIAGAVRADTGHARRVTAVRQNTRQESIYKGDVLKLQDGLVRAGFQDWTIENLTLREELDMRYGSQ